MVLPKQGLISLILIVFASELEVDENGTIASALTALQIASRADLDGPSVDTPVDFYVNRPFLVTITHGSTGTILFAGIVRNPTE